MKINNTALKTLGVGFQATFKNGLGMATAQHELVATKVTSTTGKEEYGWLGKFPGSANGSATASSTT
jgi:phage major head subunit gpT-like protein